MDVNEIMQLFEHSSCNSPKLSLDICIEAFPTSFTYSSYFNINSFYFFFNNYI